jgi:hypothetical protein
MERACAVTDLSTPIVDKRMEKSRNDLFIPFKSYIYIK